ncbi:MAG: C2H2-type zinc finger protein [Actinomycetota bacterium]
MAATCAKCGAEFETEEQLRAHEQETHGAPSGGGFICGVCGMEFATQEEHDAHAKAEHGA